MKLYDKWAIQLKYNIGGGGVLDPTIDPYDKSVFYVSDGWGTSYGSIRIRKLSLETGEELANILTRDFARHFYFNSKNIIVCLNKRILKLNRDDFSLQATYKTNVPRYTDYVGSDDLNTLLLMNYNSQYLFNFNMQTEKSTKKKVDSCCGIERIETDTFWIFNYDSILQYDINTNKLKKLIATERYLSCARDALGQIYFLCANPERQADANGENTACSSRILIYSPELEHPPQEIIPGIIVDEFRISADGHFLYLHQKNELWLYSIPEKEIIFHHIFQDDQVFNIFTEEAVIMTYTHNSDNDYNRLTCWKLEV